MKNGIKKIKNLLLSPFVMRDYARFRAAEASMAATGAKPRFSLSPLDFYPQIFDKTLKTGFDRHYVYHTAWAARVVNTIQPNVHVDISSSLYFSAIVSAFVPVKFYDFRPAELNLDGFESGHTDLTKLDFADNSIPSLSCLHTVEHIGLGRYGDPIDPNGDIKACNELSRVLAPGGSFLFVVPVGSKATIEFNAHRIYTYEQVLSLFPNLTLKEFSLIPERKEQGGLIRNADPAMLKHEHYACGCFWFTKPSQKST